MCNFFSSNLMDSLKSTCGPHVKNGCSRHSYKEVLEVNTIILKLKTSTCREAKVFAASCTI